MPFTCPKCGMTSHHPKDEEERYCGNCHAFMGDIQVGDESERGEELKTDQLVYKTVYILQKEGRPGVTMWYNGKPQEGRQRIHFHAFYSGVTKTTLLLLEGPDGTLVDDSLTPIHVYRYLGKV